MDRPDHPPRFATSSMVRPERIRSALSLDPTVIFAMAADIAENLYGCALDVRTVTAYKP